MSILNFDLVVLSCIGQFCRPKDLCKLSKVNRQMYDLIGQSTKNKSDFVYFSKMWDNNVINSHNWDHGSSFIRSEGQMKPSLERTFISDYLGSSNGHFATRAYANNTLFSDHNKGNEYLSMALTISRIDVADIISIVELRAKTNMPLFLILWCILGKKYAKLITPIQQTIYIVLHKDIIKYLNNKTVTKLLNNHKDPQYAARCLMTFPRSFIIKNIGNLTQQINKIYISGITKSLFIYDIIVRYEHLKYYIDFDQWTLTETIALFGCPLDMLKALVDNDRKKCMLAWINDDPNGVYYLIKDKHPHAYPFVQNMFTKLTKQQCSKLYSAYDATIYYPDRSW